MNDAYNDLRKKSAKELETLLAEMRGTLHELKCKLSIGQLKNVREITTTRTTIARILTVVHAARAASTSQR